MRSQLRIVAAFVCVLGLVLARPVVSRTTEAPRLIVHEWGTFTSIAGADGQAVPWLPKSGPSDLPCFVRGEGALKYEAPSTIRMETPVLYFYSPFNQRVDVSVRFPDGRITEWFPKATREPGAAGRSIIEWKGVEVLTGPDPQFRIDRRPSHYYAARATDAASIQLDNETEKFLFYRGVGNFATPVSAIVRQDDRVLAWNPSGQPLGDVVLFQRHGSATSFQVRRVLTPQTTFDAPAASSFDATPESSGESGFSRTDDVGGALEKILIANGLFAKEAAAMVNTWRDSWFDEGTHLYYIVPPATLDALLPLDITPTPNDLQRVFVGRIEVASQTTQQEIRTAIQTLDFVPVAKYGRFLAPFAKRFVLEAPPNDRKLIRQRIDWALIPDASRPDSSSCGK